MCRSYAILPTKIFTCGTACVRCQSIIQCMRRWSLIGLITGRCVFMDEVHNISAVSEAPRRLTPHGDLRCPGRSVVGVSIPHLLIHVMLAHCLQCEKCGNLVKRAMNRPPQEADCNQRQSCSMERAACSFHLHQKNCGGTYIKVTDFCLFL